jgi:hypothetical protein
MWVGFGILVLVMLAILLLAAFIAYEYLLYLLSDIPELFVPFVEKIAPYIIGAIGGAVPTFLIVRRQ